MVERQIRPSYSYGSVSNQEGKLMKLGEFLIFINYGSDSGSKVEIRIYADKDMGGAAGYIAGNGFAGKKTFRR